MRGLEPARTLMKLRRDFVELLAERTSGQGTARKALYRYVDWRERHSARPAAIADPPPAELRFRVHGDLSLESFLETGKQCRDDIQNALRQVAREIGSFERILDFGCGCGRTLLWFAPWAGRTEFHGTDIDEEAIDWCRRSLGFAQFELNNELPPLSYPDATFDLVYAISVFTHLTDELQARWLNELRRVVAPGGYVLFTVRGRSYAADLPAREREELQANGFVFSKMPESAQNVFPPWYQLATQTEEYVRERCAPSFDVVRYLPHALDGCQDIVLLRRPPARQSR